MVYSATADFTKTPGVLSNQKTYTIATKKSIPDVVGKTVAEAKSILANEGFTNVTVSPALNDSDTVTATIPSASSSRTYSLDTKITLF